MTSELLSGRLVLGIRTLLAMLLGLAGAFMVVLAALAPRTTTVLVVQLFAFYALLDGLLSIVASMWAARRVVPRCLMALEGLVEVGTSVVALVLIGGYGERPPGGLLALIAMWAIVTGALQLAWTFSVDLRRGRVLLAATAALDARGVVPAATMSPPGAGPRVAGHTRRGATPRSGDQAAATPAGTLRRPWTPENLPTRRTQA
jgi:uncharacterized membrane protein HdeD (DUF308 family)